MSHRFHTIKRISKCQAQEPFHPLKRIAEKMTRRDALIAEHEDEAVPEGWKLVPIEPTVEMLRDGANQCLNFYSEKGPYPRSRAVYRAMLDAAPPAPETKK